MKLSSNKHLKKFYELSSSEAEDSDDDEEDKEADSEIEETTQSLSAAVTGGMCSLTHILEVNGLYYVSLPS